MEPKTIKGAIAETLERLSKNNFEKFVDYLVDRRAEPRVPAGQVEGESFGRVAAVMVSTFTEDGALGVALDILKQIRCLDEAKKLEEETGGKTAQPVSNNGASAGASGGNTTADCKHFVDKHRTALVNRVSNIEPILDGLFEKGILKQEGYDKIRFLSTPQEKMRDLYSGCLKAAGNAGKDVFYELLEKHEAYLFRELKAL